MLSFRFNQSEVQAELNRSKRIVRNVASFIQTNKIPQRAAESLAAYMTLVIKEQLFPMAKSAAKGSSMRSKKTGRFIKSKYRRWKEKNYPASANLAAILTTALMTSFMVVKTGKTSYKVTINPNAVGHKGAKTEKYAPRVEGKYGFWTWGVNEFLTREWPKFVASAREDVKKAARG